MTNVIASNHKWCEEIASRLEKGLGKSFSVIKNKEDLNPDNLKSINPNYIFFPHWSYLIPKEIFENFKCVIFHMTDLPYGRGGSPLQNLIVRKYKDTMISAIQCVEELDAGPVYLKMPLSLEGSAKEIFFRASYVIEKMIIEILEKNLRPTPQSGEITNFRRRKSEDGDWSQVETLDEVYDYIRMLDAEGYPSAFVRVGKYRLEFSSVSWKKGDLNATVNISMENRNE